MIEVNLLPGAKKKSRKKSASINFAAIGAAISERVKDKYLAAAVITGALAAAAIIFLFLGQQNRQRQLLSAQEVAVADSTKYAAAMDERARVLARRDSAMIQFKVIKAIDEDRFIWPHIMDEVSRALPPYTWLTVMNLAGPKQGQHPAAAMKTAAHRDTSAAARARPAPPPVLPQDTVQFRIVGRTVDIQAFTRFMRSLEDSPFIQNVNMEKTEVAVEGGKDVTQFTLNMTFSRPDSLLLHRVALTFAPAPR
jgi:Tfp pilus assembly protein PilN